MYSSINDSDVKKEIYHIISLRIGFEGRIDSLIQMHEYGYIKLYGDLTVIFGLKGFKNLFVVLQKSLFYKDTLEKL